MNRQQQREIEAILEESGLPWEIRCGKTHRHVIVAGEIAAKVPGCGKGAERGRAHLNAIASIRRIIRSRNV